MKRVLLACAVLIAFATGCPEQPPTVDYSKCPTAASGQVQVAVVVENAPNAAHKVVCVAVADGANGIDVLNARQARLGTAPLRFKNGFLCAIDDVPTAPTCGTDPAGPDGYTYWSYWQGGTSWSEYQVGASDSEVHQGSVEGWNYGTWNFVNTFPTAPTHSSSFSALTGSSA
ncbi:MAG: hypothetical protein R2698_05325 [Microthrixaceae bacterium]